MSEHAALEAVAAEESAELQGIPLGAPLRSLVVRRGEDLVEHLGAEVADVSAPA